MSKFVGRLLIIGLPVAVLAAFIFLYIVLAAAAPQPAPAPSNTEPNEETQKSNLFQPNQPTKLSS